MSDSKTTSPPVTSGVAALIWGRPYSAKVRMDWSDGDHITTTIPEVWARSRISAVAKAARIAQHGVEYGWDRLTVEECK